jgi:hypothetical protein
MGRKLWQIPDHLAGRSQVVAGSAKNKARAAAARLMPDQARAATHARMTKPEGE